MSVHLLCLSVMLAHPLDSQEGLTRKVVPLALECGWASDLRSLHTHPRPSAEKCPVQLYDPVGCGQPRFRAGCKPPHGLFSQV